jgi:hypothetical protein
MDCSADGDERAAPGEWHRPMEGGVGMVDGRRSALIVANYRYSDPGLRELRAPASDAKALAGVLQDPQIGGFEVRTLLNEPAHLVNLAVEEFFADRRPDDLLLLHFSCHGVKDEEGELYFAATDTNIRRLGATAVAADFVNRRMGRSRSRRVVLLLDCCYAGAFERGLTARAGTRVGIEEHFGGHGRAVITASSAMEYSFEGAELADSHEPAPSVFTSALVEGLKTGEADRDQDGLVGLDELYDYVYDKVRLATPNQTPGKWLSVQGELYIARRSRPVTTPSAVPPELQEAMKSPFVGVRVGAVQELARMLQSRHAGQVLAAKLALEHLVDDDSRAVAGAAEHALGAHAEPATPPSVDPTSLPAVKPAESTTPAPSPTEPANASPGAADGPLLEDPASRAIPTPLAAQSAESMPAHSAAPRDGVLPSEPSNPSDAPRRWLSTRAGILTCAGVALLLILVVGVMKLVGNSRDSHGEAPQAGAVILWDNFSSRGNGWTGAGGGAAAYGDGAFHLTYGAAVPGYEWATPRTASGIYPSAPADLRVKVDAGMLSGDINDYYGVVCRSGPHGEGYSFTIEHNYVNIRKLTVSHLHDRDLATYDPNEHSSGVPINMRARNQLTVACSNRGQQVHLEIFLNNVRSPVAQAEDKTHPYLSGSVALLAGKGPDSREAIDAEFDNVSVEQL